jgi:hypothetical protein
MVKPLFDYSVQQGFCLVHPAMTGSAPDSGKKKVRLQVLNGIVE